MGKPKAATKTKKPVKKVDKKQVELKEPPVNQDLIDKWNLTKLDKKILTLVLHDTTLTDKMIGERLGYNASYICRIRNKPGLKAAINDILKEPIERMREAKRLAVHRLIDLLKSHDPNDVKYAIDRILAAEIGVLKAQLDINLNKNEHYVVHVKHDDGSVTVYDKDTQDANTNE